MLAAYQHCQLSFKIIKTLSARSGDLSLVPGKKFTLVGTPEGDEIKDPSSRSFSSEVADTDFLYV